MSHVAEVEQAAYEAREAAWERKAEYKDWRCQTCGEIPPFEERETFFETGSCAHCEARYQRFMKE